MGSAASTLSPTDAAHVTQAMKRKLAQYQAENLTDDEIRLKLSSDYKDIVDNLHKEDHSPKLTSDSNTGSQKSGKSLKTPVGHAGSKKERDGLTSKFGGKKDAKSKGTTRRRSFDQNTIAKKPDVAAAAAPAAAPQNEVSHAQLPALSEKQEPDVPTTSSHATVSEVAAATTPTVPAAVESAHPSNLHEIADSWDSVSQQPYCKICQMAFKSETFLERHIKFSDLHAQNVKKKEKLDEAAKSGAPPPSLVPDRLAPRQVEGEHFKMLYTGSKFFWRTQESIDLHFYLHVLPHTIEIISYDTTKSKELNRVYLDYSTLLDIVIDSTKANSSMQREMARKKEAEEDTDMNGENSPNAPNAAAAPSFGSGKLSGISGKMTVNLRTDEDAQRTALTTYILQRLQVQAASTSAAGDTHSSVSAKIGSTKDLLNSASSPTLPSLASVTANSQTGGSSMTFVKLAGDNYKRSPVLEKPPIVLVPVVVTRRRRTNAEEIDATISSLTSDRQALAAATGQAEKIANLVYSSASEISSVKWWMKLNPWRRKWVWAIRRVIRQRLVADTKRNLAERAARKSRSASNVLSLANP